MAEHIAPDAALLRGWRKSSYSDNDAASCVEVADGYLSCVPVRDSKDPHGPALIFPVASWVAFIEAIKKDQARK